jgi:hypothetical protein
VKFKTSCNFSFGAFSQFKYESILYKFEALLLIMWYSSFKQY